MSGLQGAYRGHLIVVASATKLILGSVPPTRLAAVVPLTPSPIPKPAGHPSCHLILREAHPSNSLPVTGRALCSILPFDQSGAPR